MFTANNYVKVKDLEEAWQLNQKRRNKIVGGMLWLKMSKLNYNTIIDMSDLGLEGVEESDDVFVIGCMTSLRELECHKGLNAYTNGAVKEALAPIVGVQFRNLATLGGSLFSRAGFSDVLTLFTAMDSYVELYKGGIIPLSQFVNRKMDNDILVSLIIKKAPAKYSYQSVRKATSDFAVLNCAAELKDGNIKTVFGARPGRAVIFEEEYNAGANAEELNDLAEKFAERAKEAVETGTNVKGSAEYRKHLVGVFAKRAYINFGGEK